MLGDLSIIVNIIVAEKITVQVCLDDGEEVGREKDVWIFLP
jgi:hypothetical protein